MFKWRCAWKRGELTDGYTALLPVIVSSWAEPESKISTAADPRRVSDGGSIIIQFRGRALISVEHGAEFNATQDTCSTGVDENLCDLLVGTRLSSQKTLA